MPPGLSAPASRIGPVSAPQGNPGNAQASVALVHGAVQALQKALPGLPMGSPLHTAVLKHTSDLTKAIGEHHADSSQKMQAMLDFMRSIGQNPMQQAMQRAMPGGGGPNMGGGPPPGAPPPGAGAPPQPPPGG